MLLDFSKKENWIKAARLAINEVIPQEIISLAQQEDQDTMFEDDLNYILKHYEPFDPWISVEGLGDDFDECICHHYKKNKGFHACRIISEDSYRKHGLREINKDLLLELALERVEAFTTHEKIAQACSEVKIRVNDCGVYFFERSFNLSLNLMIFKY